MEIKIIIYQISKDITFLFEVHKFDGLIIFSYESLRKLSASLSIFFDLWVFIKLLLSAVV